MEQKRILKNVIADLEFLTEDTQVPYDARNDLEDCIRRLKDIDIYDTRL